MSTRFEDKIDFSSRTHLLVKRTRNWARKLDDVQTPWSIKVDFSPRFYRLNSPPKVKNFDCLCKSPPWRSAAAAGHPCLQGSSHREKDDFVEKRRSHVPVFKTVFYPLDAFHVRLHVANQSDEHKMAYRDPKPFHFREYDPPKMLQNPEWTSRRTPDPMSLRDKTRNLTKKGVYRVKTHCFRDTDPGSMLTRMTPKPKYERDLLFPKENYPTGKAAHNAYLGRVADSIYEEKKRKNVR